ncbi:MAG: hypothetical protein ACRDOA_14995 [Streptosporangiaceae bacterium]
MPELSIDEMQAETGELLPERETLATIIVIGNVGSAVAIQHNAFQSLATAHNHQSVNIAIDSFNGIPT